MRTGGDDIAEALALLGVQPVWDGPSRRVVDFEILPLSIIGRPRVDVTLRISGFFRDAFPNLIDLFDRAVLAILPVGIIEAGMALSSQSANLFPVGDEFILLQVDLGGILGMCLLQAFSITTESIDLIEGQKM